MPKKDTKKDTKLANFEQQLSELETIVEQMEQGELTLDDALKQFERGVALVDSCQGSLQQVEQKVKTLLEKQGKQQLVDFDEDCDE